MPGPYDLSGTERSFASRLPMGLGSEGMGSMWPDALLLGGGFFMRRAAMGMVSPRGFEFIGSRATKAMENRFSQILVREGETSLRIKMFDTMRKQYSRLPTASGISPHVPGATGGPFGSATPLAGAASRSRSTGQRFFSDYGKGGGVLTEDALVKNMQRNTGRSLMASRLFSTSRYMTGVGKMLIGAQIGAFALDATRSFGEAVVDWRPRASKPYPYEFGNVFYDPRGAYTQRQRVMMAIHDSQLSTRAAIGNEASFMHG